MHGAAVQVFQQQSQWDDSQREYWLEEPMDEYGGTVEREAAKRKSELAVSDVDMATRQIFAVNFGSQEMLSALIEQDRGRRSGISRSADFALVDSEGQTPLMAAAWCPGRVDLLNVLLSAYPESIDAVHDDGYTAFNLACDSNEIECVQALVIAKCDMTKHVLAAGTLLSAKKPEAHAAGSTMVLGALATGSTGADATLVHSDSQESSVASSTMALAPEKQDKGKDPARPPDDTNVAASAFGGRAPQQVPILTEQNALLMTKLAEEERRLNEHTKRKRRDEVDGSKPSKVPHIDKTKPHLQPTNMYHGNITSVNIAENIAHVECETERRRAARCR